MKAFLFFFFIWRLTGACVSKTLIMTDVATRGIAGGILEQMAVLKTADDRIAKSLVSAAVYSSQQPTELLVPWSNDFQAVKRQLANFRPGVSASPSPAARRDVVLAQAVLGVKYFRPLENGAVVLLTSSSAVSNLTEAVLQQHTLGIPVVVGFIDNEDLAGRDSQGLLKYVDLSDGLSLKQQAIARFLLYYRCGSPEPASVLGISRVEFAEAPVSPGSTTPAPSASPSRVSTAVAAGSVAAASAGVAAVSVFAGRWFQTKRRSSNAETETETEDGDGVPTFDSLQTPPPRRSLDIDDHDLRTPSSPVQHINFTMF
eukprot:Gregarina_sp_Pseudo_9__1345@NODE_18_length_6061_cov_60_328462_g16_i0_p3_GENE_NODE_18_length_6061_cov_60_328462_g16_i0NODE_18_length_6061_cov_60_328462_g16_i0_p3_ORF_typecomplete_len315_score98_63CoatB/PF10389_9/9_2e03CoatB/PF10389_9/0_033Herpes_gE/PF02480_16/0_15_NODE_18_length_6061_cov_60_328462_g16_i031394083